MTTVIDRTGVRRAQQWSGAVMSGAALVMVSACSGDQASPSQAEPATSSTTPTTSPSTSETDRPEPAGSQVRITAGDTVLTATLRDSVASRDLLAQLPISVDMSDHGGVEKTGRIPAPLSLEGQPDGADPDPRDLGYYARGQDLVLYYGDQGYFPGIVVLGTLDGDVDALSDGDQVTVRVEIAPG